MSHWTEKYLAVNYEKDGTGPFSFDCWYYFRWVQQDHYGIVMPDMPTPETLFGMTKALKTWAEALGWFEVFTPRDGDAVYMTRAKQPSHIGIWVDGLPVPHVLHCAPGGAKLHDAIHLKTEMWVVKNYYRFGKEV